MGKLDFLMVVCCVNAEAMAIRRRHQTVPEP